MPRQNCPSTLHCYCLCIPACRFSAGAIWYSILEGGRCPYLSRKQSSAPCWSEAAEAMQAGRLEWTAPVVERTSRHTRQLVERMLSLTPSERPTPDEVRDYVCGG